MARFISTLAGLTVATATLSAVHLDVAAGSGLDTFQERYSAAAADSSATPTVNRDDKADRLVAPAFEQGKLRTIAVKVDQLENTSVLVRVPGNRAENTIQQPDRWPSKTDAKPQPRRIVACEPVVSALTEVAKLLEPGRCVT